MVKSYRCLVCGYIHVGETPPGTCPVCGVSSKEFAFMTEPLPSPEGQPARFWRCLSCEYVHEGGEPPETCPICGVNRMMFEPLDSQQSVGQSPVGAIRIVIVGGGIAGVAAAEAIVKHADKAQVTLVSKEECLPYYRLNLTRYLAKEIDEASLTIYPREWYQERGITVLLGQEVTAIQPELRKVELDDGTELTYDKLILATGSHPFVPPIPGSDLKNVMTVRTLADAAFLQRQLQEPKTCVCIGGGILGLETAGAIAKSGVKVTLLEGAEWLMPRQLNKKAAACLKQYLHSSGIEVKENVNIQQITGQEYCEGVRVASGEYYPADLVIITAGVRPNTHLARQAGLTVNQGVVADSHLQTSAADIFAAGDIAEHNGMLYGLWNAAQSQGRFAGQNTVGLASEFGALPRSSVLKVLGLDMFSIGELSLADGSYYQYEQETPGGYIFFVLRDTMITGSIVIGDKELSLKVKEAIEKERRFPRQVYPTVESLMRAL